MTTARMVCPRTCGCHTPWGGSAFGSIKLGCAHNCGPNPGSPEWSSEEEDYLCSDIDLTNSSRSHPQLWQSWQRWVAELHVTQPELSRNMSAQGCDFIRQDTAGDYFDVCGSWPEDQF